MKKFVKWIALFMALVLTAALFSGCASSSSGEDEGEDANKKPVTMTIAVPHDADADAWADVMSSWIEDFKTYYKVTLKFTRMPDPENTKEMKSFMKKVKNGSIAAFFSERADYIDTMIEKDYLIDLETVRERYNAVLEEAGDALFSLSEEHNLRNYMIPVYGTYQGLYYNRTLLKELNLPNPTSWENLLADIEGLKKAGKTPIAAGFRDEGLSYLVEELILSEGGTAEHSYTPSFGVVSSWERAVADIKTLSAAGAFSADCYNTSFQSAVDSFLNGEAAMIVAPSTAFGGDLAADDVKVVGFPVTPTGKREEGAFVGRLTFGLYISKNYFNKSDSRYSENLVEMLGADYTTGAGLYQVYASESTFTPYKAYYNDYASTQMDAALKSLVSNAKDADWPLKERAYAYDAIIDGFRKALTGTDAAAALQEATNAEISARDAAEG